MSTMAEETKTPRRRVRRQFTDAYKAEAVRMVLDEGRTVGAVARDLDLTGSALRLWVEHARADRSQGKTGLTTADREELARLRKENRQLRMDRDILVKAAAGSTRRCNAGRQSISRCVVAKRLARAHVEAACDRPDSTRGRRARSRDMRVRIVG